MVFLIKRANVFWRTVVSCLASSVVMFACFVFLPVEYPRPDIVTTDFSSALLSFTQEVDFAHNTCPSGHVAFAWLMFLAAINTQWIKQEPWMGRVTLLWSIGIIMSTLVLKQHFIADVFAGVFLASFSFYCSKFVVPNKLTAS
jgi:membrane-associated phospholipid phosphatase